MNWCQDVRGIYEDRLKLANVLSKYADLHAETSFLHGGQTGPDFCIADVSFIKSPGSVEKMRFPFRH